MGYDSFPKGGKPRDPIRALNPTAAEGNLQNPCVRSKNESHDPRKMFLTTPIATFVLSFTHPHGTDFFFVYFISQSATRVYTELVRLSPSDCMQTTLILLMERFAGLVGPPAL